MLNFLAGIAVGVLLMLIAVAYVTRPPKTYSGPALCPHNQGWDDCPDCCH